MLQVNAGVSNEASFLEPFTGTQPLSRLACCAPRLASL